MVTPRHTYKYIEPYQAYKTIFLVLWTLCIWNSPFPIKLQIGTSWEQSCEASRQATFNCTHRFGRPHWTIMFSDFHAVTGWITWWIVLPVQRSLRYQSVSLWIRGKIQVGIIWEERTWRIHFFILKARQLPLQTRNHFQSCKRNQWSQLPVA